MPVHYREYILMRTLEEGHSYAVISAPGVLGTRYLDLKEDGLYHVHPEKKMYVSCADASPQEVFKRYVDRKRTPIKDIPPDEKDGWNDSSEESEHEAVTLKSAREESV